MIAIPDKRDTILAGTQSIAGRKDFTLGQKSVGDNREWKH
jgi:hypothetical protein